MSVNTIDICLNAAELEAAQLGTLASDLYRHLHDCELCGLAFEGFALMSDEQKAEWRSSRDHPQELFANQASEPLLLPSLKTATSKVLLWSLAACVLALLIFGGINYLQQAPPAQDPSLAKLDLVDPYPRRLRSSPSVQEDHYFSAALAFEKGDLQKSIREYQLALLTAESEILVSRGFYEVAVAYWYAEHPDSAISYMTRARMAAPDYFEDASWALAQFYEKSGEIAAARSVYADVSAIPNSPFALKAKTKVEELGREAQRD